MKIGITGHQNLDNPAWVKTQIVRALRDENTSIIGITSLAIGADQLFAQSVIECGGALEIIIPFAGYAEVFKEQGRAEYQKLLALASKTEVLSTAHSNEEAYLNAGKRVVDLSELLVAVWNGKPSAGLGGTADIVEYARQQFQKIIHINPDNQSVHSI